DGFDLRQRHFSSIRLGFGRGRIGGRRRMDFTRPRGCHRNSGRRRAGTVFAPPVTAPEGGEDEDIDGQKAFFHNLKGRRVDGPEKVEEQTSGRLSSRATAGFTGLS